jgi:hypothetical protein
MSENTENVEEQTCDMCKISYVTEKVTVQFVCKISYVTEKVTVPFVCKISYVTEKVTVPFVFWPLIVT